MTLSLWVSLVGHFTGTWVSPWGERSKFLEKARKLPMDHRLQKGPVGIGKKTSSLEDGSRLRERRRRKGGGMRPIKEGHTHVSVIIHQPKNA